MDDGLTDIAALIIVGYSRLDFFDLDPYWRELNERRELAGRVVFVGRASQRTEACVPLTTHRHINLWRCRRALEYRHEDSVEEFYPLRYVGESG